MSHLDVLERTPDRLVLRWHTPASENVLLGIVIAAIVGFICLAVYFLVTNFDWLLLSDASDPRRRTRIKNRAMQVW